MGHPLICTFFNKYHIIGDFFFFIILAILLSGFIRKGMMFPLAMKNGHVCAQYNSMLLIKISQFLKELFRELAGSFNFLLCTIINSEKILTVNLVTWKKQSLYPQELAVIKWSNFKSVINRVCIIKVLRWVKPWSSKSKT